jgi:hypothetical protein
LGVFWIKRRWDAKDHFAVTVSKISGEFQRPCDVLEFYDRTFTQLEDAVFRAHPFLCKGQRACLSTIWSLYRNARDELQKSEIERLSERFNEEFRAQAGQLPKDKREIIAFFHRKFMEIAK